MSPEYTALVDDRGTPVRWKVATVLSAAALIVSLVLQIAKAGAKSEKLDNLAAKVTSIESQLDIVARMDERQKETLRRLDQLDAKVDKALERRR